MNQVISNHRSRAGRMKNFFTESNSFIVPNTDIINEIADFNNLLTRFDEFAVRQQQPITGYAEVKQQALVAVAEVVSKWGVRCNLKARISGMATLAQLLNHTVPAIIRMQDMEGLNLMKDIRNGLNTNIALFAELGVTAAVITQISNAISAYETLMNKPKEAINERKMETVAMETLMKEVNKKIESIVPLLEALWSPDHMELVTEMKNNQRIEDLGHRYSGIAGTVVNSVPGVTNLANYKVVCEGAEKVAVSNLLGEYKIQSMKPGMYVFKVLNPAGEPVQTAILTIKRGVTLEHVWRV